MRHIIIPTVLPAMMMAMVCVAASCTSDPGQVAPESGEELTIEATEAAGSRATVTTNSNLTTMSFLLFGDVIRTGEYHNGLKIIFNGDKVTYSNNKWDYGTTPLYWLMGQEHSFVALHPDLNSIPGISDLTYAASKVSFTYTIPKNNDDITEYNKVNDLLAATHRRLYTMDSTGAVKFGFRHILSRINIEPALDEVLMYEDENDKGTHPENKDEYIQYLLVELN